MKATRARGALCKCRDWNASSVIHGRHRSKDKNSKEKWQRNQNSSTEQVLAKAWEYVCAVSRDTQVQLHSVSPCWAYTSPLGTRHARWHRAVVWDWQCVARVWARRPTGGPGTITLFDVKEFPDWPGTACMRYGLHVVPARALGARSSCYCPAKGGWRCNRRGSASCWYIGMYLHTIVYYQFLLQMERKHAAPHSKVWGGNYACWLSLLLPPSQLFLIFTCI